MDRIKPEITPEYQAFVDKFKIKLTTDDCYTPSAVYNAVLGWCVERYGIDPERVVRPFWPGADYENADYPEGCVVVDNPPFSILSKIIGFYLERGIRFFLFAPARLIVTPKLDVTRIFTGVCLTYENGAQVATNFVTNLEPGDVALMTAPELTDALKTADKENRQGKPLPKYAYPPEVLQSYAIEDIGESGIEVTFRQKELHFVRWLDAQKPTKKAIYGAGYLMGSSATKKMAAARREAARRAAARRAAANQTAGCVWELSPRERAIIDTLE